MITAVGLAAGRLPFGNEAPPTLMLRNHRLVDLQISALRQAGVRDVVYVTGHRGVELMRADVEAVHNPHWETTSASDSLRLAMERTACEGTDLLLFYGDTLFDARLVSEVVSSQEAITICTCSVDGPNEYREWCTVADGRLRTVGHHSNDASGVFTGLVYIRQHKVPFFKSQLSVSQSFPDLLNRLVADEEPVHAHRAERGWMELRTARSLERVDEDPRFLSDLIQIHTNWMQRAERYNELEWVNRDVLTEAIGEVCLRCRPQRHLDVGTGTGKILEYVKRLFPAVESWGVDISQAMMDKIEGKSAYRLVVANAEDLSELPHEYFDLVTARMVFHHIRSIPNALEASARVLRRNGTILVCEGNPPTARAVDWYTDMFRYKEDRHTLTEIDLVNAFLRADRFQDVQTKSIVMTGCSLNDWLEKSGIPEENIRKIKQLHREAPDFVKEDYNMRFTETDCLMDWKFSVTYAVKR